MRWPSLLGKEASTTPAASARRYERRITLQWPSACVGFQFNRSGGRRIQHGRRIRQGRPPANRFIVSFFGGTWLAGDGSENWLSGQVAFLGWETTYSDEDMLMAPFLLLYWARQTNSMAMCPAFCRLACTARAVHPIQSTHRRIRGPDVARRYRFTSISMQGVLSSRSA